MVSLERGAGAMLTKTICGHAFGVELTDVCDAGELANGARGYTADVEVYRDGARIGAGRWDVEDFEDMTDLRGRPLDLGDGEQIVWEALGEMVREHLGYRDAPAASGLALALDPAQAHAVAYAVAILRVLADATDEEGRPTPGNTARAAAALGMSRRTLDDHIARLGLRELQSRLWDRSVRQPRRR